MTLYNILGALPRNSSASMELGHGLETLELMIGEDNGNSNGNIMNQLTTVAGTYFDSLVAYANKMHTSDSMEDIGQSSRTDDEFDAWVHQELLGALHAKVLHVCDEYMSYVGPERPAYATCIANWVTRIVLERTCVMAKQDLDIRMISRADLKKEWFNVIKEHQEQIRNSRNIGAIGVTEPSRQFNEWHSAREGAESGVSPKVEKGNDIGQDYVRLKKEYQIGKEHEMIKVMKNCSYMTRDILKFSGDPRLYGEFRCDIIAILDFYQSDDVETLLSAISDNYRAILRRKLKIGDTARTLLMQLDQEFLNSTVNMHETEYHAFCQARNETLADFTIRFERILQVREALVGGMDDHAKARKYRSSLRGKEELEANRICDPAQRLGYIEFKQALTELVAYWRSSSVQAASWAPGLALNAIRPSQKCYRCNSVGHFAEKCNAERVYNAENRCSKCGTATHATALCKQTQLVCRRCGKSGHISGVCRAKAPLGAMPVGAVNTTDDLVIQNHTITVHCYGKSGHTSEVRRAEAPLGAMSVGAVDITHDLVIQNHTIKVHSLRIGNEHLVDLHPWVEDIHVTKGNRECKIGNCLKDTGASASFIHKDVADFLIRNDMVSGHQKVDFAVEYANGTGEKITDCVHLKVKIAAGVGRQLAGGFGHHTIGFLVTKNCCPRVILGRPILKQLEDRTAPEVSLGCGAVVVDVPANPTLNHGWIEEQGCNLVARLPLLEDAKVLPYRERERKFSVTDNNICYARLSRMADEGKVEMAVASECQIILAPRLVDKATGLRHFRDPDDAEMHKRYRVTIDCRPLNEMILVQDGESASFMLLPPDQLSKTAANQSQLGGREILNSLPFTQDSPWYGKIDLSDAFSSVQIPSGLRRLLAVSISDYQGNPVCFRWKCLPQGWKHSPFLFSLCIDSILRRLDDNLVELGVTARHFQDDIIVAGSEKDQLQKSMNILIANLTKKGFHINENKCTWPTESITFCGFKLANGTLSPLPKTPLTKKLIQAAWKNFLTSDERGKIKWLREWAGRFQFWRGYVDSTKTLPALKVFYDQELDPVILEPAFHILVDSCISCIPLAFGHTNSLRNIIVVDANCQAWGGILFKAVRRADSASLADYSNDSDVSGKMRELHLSLVQFGVPEPFDLIPFKLSGDLFTSREQRHSSTQRERIAQLECFADCYTTLDAPLIMVCDNRNCSLTWHNLDLFGARHLDMWERLQSSLDGHLWLPRDSIPAYADLIARVVGDEVVDNFRAEIFEDTDAREEGSDSLPDENEHSPVVMNDALRREIIRGQRLDDHSSYHGVKLSRIYQILKSEISDDSRDSRIATRRFQLVDDVLHFRSTTGTVCVIPDAQTEHLIQGSCCSFRAGLFNIYHDKMAHPGSTRLLLNLSRTWYWPSMHSDIRKYVAGCKNCRLAIPSRIPSGGGELSSLAIRAHAPWELLMMDFCVYRGQDYDQDILLVIDCYSHWLFSYAVPDQTANTVAKFLKELFKTIGFPKSIISDNGVHFVNDTIRILSDSLGFNVWVGSTYHPRRQGLIERAVGEIKLSIKKINSTKENFENDLQIATMTHNMSPFLFHPDLCPYALVFGRMPRWLALSETHATTVPEDVKSLREAWEKARILHQEKVNDRIAITNRAPLTSGMQVIWRFPGEVPTIKTVIEQAPGVGNHWILSDGRSVPETQLEPMIDDAPDLRVEHPNQWEVAAVGDLILFVRDEHMDVGRIVQVHPDSVLVVNLYMDESGAWHEHGDEYTDLIPQDRVVRAIRLTRTRKVDRRSLH